MTALASAPPRAAARGQTAVLLLGLGLPLVLFTANPWLSAASIAVLAWGVALLWRPPEPAALLFAFTFQWLQVTTKVWYADALGLPVAELGTHGVMRIAHEAVPTAVWLSLAGLAVLALSIRLALGHDLARRLHQRLGSMPSFSINRLFQTYLCSFAAASLFAGVGHSVPGLRQPLVPLTDIRFFFLFMLAVVCLTRRTGYALLAAAIALEVVVGATGYFAAFKTGLFILVIAYFTVRPTLRPATLASAALLAAVLLSLGLVWTAVKQDYRDFLNQGTGQQVVLVPLEDRLPKLTELVAALDRDRLADAVPALVNRIAYIDFFADVIRRVPETLPYERGQLWWAAVAHVLQPRLLFPDKPVLPSDSELTMKYTGYWLSSDREGTSISVGYMAESYIDFGPLLMFAPILGLGLTLGFVTRYLLLRAPIPLYGQAAAAVVGLGAYQFEMHNVKLVGSLLVTTLFYIVWLRFAVPFIDPWLRLARRAS